MSISSIEDERLFSRRRRKNHSLLRIWRREEDGIRQNLDGNSKVFDVKTFPRAATPKSTFLSHFLSNISKNDAPDTNGQLMGPNGKETVFQIYCLQKNKEKSRILFFVAAEKSEYEIVHAREFSRGYAPSKSGNHLRFVSGDLNFILIAFLRATNSTTPLLPNLDKV